MVVSPTKQLVFPPKQLVSPPKQLIQLDRHESWADIVEVDGRAQLANAVMASNGERSAFNHVFGKIQGKRRSKRRHG